VGQRLTGWQTLAWVACQHLFEEVQSLGTESFEGFRLKVYVAVTVFLDDFFDVLTLEDWLAEHEDVVDYSKREDITWGRVCLHWVAGFYAQHLRRNVAWRSATSIEVFGGRGVLGEAQVDYHWHHLSTAVSLFHHDVFQFQVAVHHAAVMEIGDSLEKVHDNGLCSYLGGESELLQVPV
jgi:hypothetical protein